ncbi:MAG: DUF2184 domain-containing protein [Nitratireductor sp.]|nr:DUF2184 domain-containing protein [Nitratireductor sp.]
MNAHVNVPEQYLRDNQANLQFAINQASHINRRVYEKKYPEITYTRFIPIDYSTPEFAASVTYFSYDGTGKAKWINTRADDVPYANANLAKYEIQIAEGAMGYDYTLFEIGRARWLGVNLAAMNAMYARRAYEEMCEEVGYFGNEAKGFYGLINYPGITKVAAPNNAADTSALWADKNADEILLDVNNALLGVYVDSLTIEMADTILLPHAQLVALTTRRIPDTQMSIIEFLEKNNVYTRETGRKLTIKALRQLTGAGDGGTDRMVAYKRDEEVLSMHIPMAFRFLPTQFEGLQFKNPGIFRIGGLDVRRPGSVRYVDGI